MIVWSKKVAGAFEVLMHFSSHPRGQHLESRPADQQSHPKQLTTDHRSQKADQQTSPKRCTMDHRKQTSNQQLEDLRSWILDQLVKQ